MPYAEDFIGVYKIVNTRTNECYVGQSQRIKKRVGEHFRLLALQKHPNDHLQKAYDKYGKETFVWDIEIICEDLSDIDTIEEAFISGKASFPEPCVYNIAAFAKAPMRGKKHTEETKAKISASIANNTEHLKRIRSREHAIAAEAARRRARMNNPEWVAKLKFILDNDHLSYAERGRQTGKDTSTTRKLYLNNIHLKGVL